MESVVNHQPINPQFIRGEKSHRFDKFLTLLTVGVGICIPIIYGIWRFRTTSDPHPIASGLFLGVLCTFFSLGLWLSVTSFGRKYKYVVLSLIVLGIPVHLLFFSYPLWFLVIVVFAEIYSIYSVFRETKQ